MGLFFIYLIPIHECQKFFEMHFAWCQKITFKGIFFIHVSYFLTSCWNPQGYWIPIICTYFNFIDCIFLFIFAFNFNKKFSKTVQDSMIIFQLKRTFYGLKKKGSPQCMIKFESVLKVFFQIDLPLLQNVGWILSFISGSIFFSKSRSWNPYHRYILRDAIPLLTAVFNWVWLKKIETYIRLLLDNFNCKILLVGSVAGL